MNISPYYYIRMSTTGYKIFGTDIAEYIQTGTTALNTITGYKSYGADLSCTIITDNVYTKQTYVSSYYNMGNILAKSFFATSGQGNNTTPQLNANGVYTAGAKFGGTSDAPSVVATIPTWCTKIGVIVITPDIFALVELVP